MNALKEFLKLESSAGILLMAAAALALAVSNTPLYGAYRYVLDVPLAISLGELAVDKPLLLWINDGLMAIFFLLIGLELKREICVGQLRSAAEIALPGAAALGGFVLPALIYLAINRGDPEALEGWAVPAATDIAFALGVLALLGSRVPVAMKVFLTTVAIFDDLAAIVVIAVFYTGDLSPGALVLAAVGVALLAVMNRAGVTRIAAYVVVGIVLWICVLKSGVHATLAGIAVALAIPMQGGTDREGPLEHLEHTLHPWVAYLILPLFAFANAGIPFAGITTEALFGGVTAGVALGLFAGKQAGVFVAVWVLVRTGVATLPAGLTWLSLYGVALLTGIGFTMSLFIGSLAFEHGAFDHVAATRLGVLGGSIVSAVAGYLVLKVALGDADGSETPPGQPAANGG